METTTSIPFLQLKANVYVHDMYGVALCTVV